ncbi:MAG: mechanosensitive ion channel family protein [Deltaproteobacteria bacterium]|nr:mechanosensitive ion channel family protein [Deltaproteobacteria bacterium]
MRSHLADSPFRHLFRACRLLLWLLPATAAAQPATEATEADAAATSAPEPTAVAPDSPRAALGDFLALTAQGHFNEAMKYLDLPAGANGPLLAEKLRGVLDHALVVEPELLSPLPGGLADDGLPAWVDRVAEVVRDDGSREAVRMARRQDDEGSRWTFTRSTVRSIDTWYDELPDRWLRELLPESLLRPGPKGLLWWQWIALPLLALLALGLGWVLGWLTSWVLRRGTQRTRVQWDDIFVVQLRGPLTVAWGVALIYLALPWLMLPQAGEAFVHEVLRAGLFVVFFWGLVRTIHVIGGAVARSPWAENRPGAAAMIPLLVRSGKVAVWLLAAVATLSLFGFPVASLLAGLGIGGLIVALAAQKTMENFFGSVAIGVDQPFRPGDFVRVEDVIGTVESVGLRSTRIRTLDRTLVTFPNGRLAEMRSETFAARDRIRLSCTLGLVFDTTAEQMRRVLEGVEKVLRDHPKIWSDTVVVRFEAIGASSLDILVMAWFQTTDWGEFQAIRQEVLLGFLEVVERAGTSFAFPTQTVHLERAEAVTRPG